METHSATEHLEAPQEPGLTMDQSMSRRAALKTIGLVFAAAATGVLTTGCKKDKQVDEEATPASEQEPEKRELSPEQTEKVIQLLKTRSQAEKNKDLCPQLDWSRAERALRAAPIAALWSVNELEEKGHEPTVYFVDDTGFDIGTRTAETPQSTRNCVYDEKAAEPLRKQFPDLKSAVKSAEDIGFDRLMTTGEGNHIARNTKPYYESRWSYYYTPEDTRKAGAALDGHRHGSILAVIQDSADGHYGRRGWRGTRRVLYKNKA